MANPEHVNILERGVTVWNKWREENENIHPDLTDINLAGRNLNGIMFNNTNLSNANLKHAKLNSSNLHGSRFVCATLYGAEIVNSVIGGSCFYRTILRHTNLSKSSFYGAKFNSVLFYKVKLDNSFLVASEFKTCSFEKSVFNGSSLGWTSFTNCSFYKIIGLEKINHTAQSYISVDTVFNSFNSIPKAFLQGIGLPKILLEYLPDLISAQAPLQLHSCFISHSSKNMDFAQRIYHDLRNKNVSCWFAPEDLKIGDRFPVAIHEAIGLQDKLLLVLSEDSVNSPWVAREVERARALELQDGRPRLFPVRLDDAVMSCKAYWAEELRQNVHIGDFRKWQDDTSYQESFARLLHDLAKEPAPKASARGGMSGREGHTQKGSIGPGSFLP